MSIHRLILLTSLFIVAVIAAFIINEFDASMSPTERSQMFLHTFIVVMAVCCAISLSCLYLLRKNR